MAKTEFDILEDEPIGSSAELIAAMQAVQEVYVSDAFIEHIVAIVNRTRNHPAYWNWGVVPEPGFR